MNWYQPEPIVIITMEKAIAAEIMEMAIAAVIMRKAIPAEDAAADADQEVRLPDAMWERYAAHITEAHLMTEPSLIPPMTAGNRWNLPVAPDR